MLRKLLLFCFFILFPTFTFAAGDLEKAASGENTTPSISEGVRAGDVYNSCKEYFTNKFNTKENISKRATCNGFFFGVGSTLLTLKLSDVDTQVCLPNNITTHQIIQSFLDWGRINAEGLKLKAGDATIKALADRYPCKEE
jgi:hypothetical protein